MDPRWEPAAPQIWQPASPDETTMRDRASPMEPRCAALAVADGTPMELGENLPAARAGIPSRVMSHVQPATRKHLRRPAGCEGHLTRRQAAAVLGFASEFKVREFERQGLLRSVRGPMRTAFYPRPDVLALKARLAQSERVSPDEWTDADLIALLEHPTEAGQARTALDLVTETRISIERAERVHAFWAKGAGVSAPHPPSTPHPLSSAQRPLPAARGEAGSGAPHPPSSAQRPLPATRGEAGSGAPHPLSSAQRPLPAARGEAGSGAPHPLSSADLGEAVPAPHPLSSAQRPLPATRGEAGMGERRGEDRLARDSLIRELRDPDPRARQQAFERLRERRDSAGDD